MARSMIVYSGLDSRFWAEAVATAVYLRNRASTKSLVNKTPYEAWTGMKPIVSHLQTFGTLAISIDKTQRKKFHAKGKEMIMVGYSNISKAYRLYDPEAKKVIVSRDVIFMKNLYVSKTNEADLGANIYDAYQINDVNADFFDDVVQTAEDVVVEEDVVVVDKSPSTADVCAAQSNTVDETNQIDDDLPTTIIRPGKRVRGSESEDDNANDEHQQKIICGKGRPRLVRTGRPGRPRKEYRNVLNLFDEENMPIPQTVEEALNSKYSKQWHDSMQKEYESLVNNETWSLVDLPDGEKAIGNKWVFNIKRNVDGSVEKFKSRLVAKGCCQQYGVSFQETFSPVVRYATIRLLFALACENNLHLHQMDVSSAYLNSELHDTVYMKQPESFVNSKYSNKVLKLNKALYGLKQSGREWNEKLDSVLKNIGFCPCISEPCLYTNNSKGRFNIIAVYVDDLLLASSDLNDLIDIKTKIKNKFEVVDGGKLKYFLGMEVHRDGETGSLTVCQRQYINNLLNQYGMQNCRPVSTPLNAGYQISCSNQNCKRVDCTRYQSLIGSLMYLAISTRPDIVHSVCKLSQCNMDPHVEHEAGAWHILRYLKKTLDFKLHYFKTGKPIECFVDADWGGDASDRKSFTGSSFTAAGCVFSWESKKQSLVALSSTEAEYVALSSAAKEAVYIKKLLNEIGFNISVPMVLNSDNQSAQHLIKNPIYHARSKHIDIKYHHIRELYKNNEIKLNYVCTNEMMSDILTKNLSKIKHCKFTQAMGLY